MNAVGEKQTPGLPNAPAVDTIVIIVKTEDIAKRQTVHTRAAAMKNTKTDTSTDSVRGVAKFFILFCVLTIARFFPGLFLFQKKSIPKLKSAFYCAAT